MNITKSTLNDSKNDTTPGCSLKYVLISSATISGMKKVVIPIVLLVVIIAATSFWYINKDNKGISTSTKNIDSSKSGKVIQERPTPDGNWTVQQQKDVFVGYEIRELFAGDTIKKLASAKSFEVSGSFSILDGTLSGAEVKANLTKLESDSSKRDATMTSQGLETDKFPEARFVQTKDVKIMESIEKDQEHAVKVPGSLTLHGQTKQVIFPLKATWDGKVLKVSGNLEILLVDYEIEAPKNSFLSVDDNGTLKLQLLFIPST